MGRVKGGLRLFCFVSVEYCLSLAVVSRRGLFSNRAKLSCENVPLGIFVTKVELGAVASVVVLLQSLCKGGSSASVLPLNCGLEEALAQALHSAKRRIGLLVAVRRGSGRSLIGLFATFSERSSRAPFVVFSRWWLN